MGDISAEPSMEDILSSIKRIIAEEGDAAASAARSQRKAPRMSAPRADINDFGYDEILELSDPVRSDEDRAAPPAPTAVAPSPSPSAPPSPPAAPSPVPSAAAPGPAPAAPPAPAEAEAEPVAEPILSPRATQATREPLEALSRMIVKPDVSGSDTLEGMVREMIRPMLRDWMDAHLPNMVEKMVAQEIARITSQR